MATTRAKIAEEVQLLYGQFLEKNGFNDLVDWRLADVYIEQSINKYLKVEIINNLKAGKVEIPQCNILTYSLTASDSDGISKLTLPVIPLSLDNGMGVWAITPANGIPVPYIPLSETEVYVYSGTNLAFLEGQTGYWVERNVVNFTKNGITAVTVKLVVSDFQQFGKTDLLPIDPGMESTVISDVIGMMTAGRVGQAELNSIDNRRDAS